jgi:hypothetical protein
MPGLFLLSLAVCFPPLYVLNCGFGPALRPRQSARLLLLSISANAAALASYIPFSFFFTLTTSRQGYGFLILMHVAVFALAGLWSLFVIARLFRAAAKEKGLPLRPLFLLGWGALYGAVGVQAAWLLRPWIGTWSQPYVPLRPLGGSFFEAVWPLIAKLF